MALSQRASNIDQISQFRVVADRVSEIASKYSVSVVGYHDPELPHYSALSASKRAEVLEQLKVFLGTMEAVEDSGDRLDNASRSLWHALSSMKIVPPSDLLSKINSGDLIEIYDLQNVQIWRNFNFLKFCSYTIEEIYSIDWPSRYVREEKRTAECIAKVGALLSGQTPDVFFADIRDHVLEETSSSERLILQASHNWLGRLRNQNGQVVAWVVFTSAKLLGKRTLARRPRASFKLVQSPSPLNA